MDAVSKRELRMRLYLAEQLLRSGSVNPQIWQDAPLCYTDPRSAAYAAVRTIDSPDFVTFEGDTLLSHLWRAFYMMRQSLGVRAPVAALWPFQVKGEPASQEEIMTAAQRYVDRLLYWPKRECSIADLRARGMFPPVLVPQRVQVAVPAPVERQTTMDENSDTEDEVSAPQLCLDCGVATGRRATWMCTPCKCGPVTCGVCRQQRLLAESGWTKCPKCDKWARSFKRV